MPAVCDFTKKHTPYMDPITLGRKTLFGVCTLGRETSNKTHLCSGFISRRKLYILPPVLKFAVKVTVERMKF